MSVVYMVTFFDGDDDMFIGLYSNFKKACDAADKFVKDNYLTIDEVWNYGAPSARHIELKDDRAVSIEPCRVQ